MISFKRKWQFSFLVLFVLCSQAEAFASHHVVTRSLPAAFQSIKAEISAPSRKHSKLDALLDPSILVAQTGVSADSIQSAFSVATFLPQPFWVLLTLLPNAGVTKKIMGGLEVVTVCALVHFFIVVTSILEPNGTAPMAEFNDVFDPSGNPQAAFMGMVQYPNFVSEEWSHVLTWDLFVGRWIWLDGLKRGVFTSHSVLFCNLIGPPGLLLHLATCLVTGKGLPSNEATEEE